MKVEISSQKIKEIRISKGLTQSALSHITKIPQSKLSFYERGRYKLTDKEKESLEKALGILKKTFPPIKLKKSKIKTITPLTEREILDLKEDVRNLEFSWYSAKKDIKDDIDILDEYIEKFEENTKKQTRMLAARIYKLENENKRLAKENEKLKKMMEKTFSMIERLSESIVKLSKHIAPTT